MDKVREGGVIRTADVGAAFSSQHIQKPGSVSVSRRGHSLQRTIQTGSALESPEGCSAQVAFTRARAFQLASVATHSVNYGR